MINIEITCNKRKSALNIFTFANSSDSLSKEEIYRTRMESSNFYIFCKYINILKRS